MRKRNYGYTNKCRYGRLNKLKKRQRKKFKKYIEELLASIFGENYMEEYNG